MPPPHLADASAAIDAGPRDCRGIDRNEGETEPVSARNLDEASDADLMVRVGRGDQRAFSALCRRHGERCLSVAFHLLRNSADAEEIVQEAFLRIWRNAPQWRSSEARVTTWMYRIVVNLCLDQLRRAIRVTLSLSHAEAVPDADPSPESIAIQRQTMQLVMRAMASLPPRQRAAIILAVREGLTCAEAAKAMQVSVGTMESLLFRARKQLRAALEGAEAQSRGEKISRLPAQESVVCPV